MLVDNLGNLFKLTENTTILVHYLSLDPEEIPDYIFYKIVYFF
jgi:hypothetical protein